MKLLRAGLLVVGVVFLCILVATNDPAAIFGSISRLGWRLAVIACFPFAIITAFDTLGWYFAFLHPRVPFRALLAARLAGEAFNLTTPTASLGGEAVKAWLLRGRVPLDESVLSVVVAKTTIMIGQGLFLLVGIVITWLAAPPDSRLLGWMLWLLGSLEAYLILNFLGLEVSLETETIIEALGTAVRFATFQVPASLGALEGGFVATFTALGLAPSAGVVFGLARRVREVVWIAVGFAIFAVIRPGPAEEARRAVTAAEPD